MSQVLVEFLLCQRNTLIIQILLSRLKTMSYFECTARCFRSDVHQRSTGLSQEVSYELTTFWHLSGSGCLISMVFCIFIFRKIAINDLKGSFLSSGFGLWGDTKKGRSHVQKEISTKRFSFSCFKLALFTFQMTTVDIISIIYFLHKLF